MNILRYLQAINGLLILGVLLVCGGCGGGGSGMTVATPTSAPTATTAATAAAPTTTTDLSRVVACVGDSITEGAYPASLASRLGSDFEVHNLGRGGTTMRKSSAKPYWSSTAYPEALALHAGIVVIMLGTNDDVDLPPSQQEYVSNYEEMIRAFRRANQNARIYTCLPPPVYAKYDKIEQVIPLIRRVATESGTTIIDVHSALSDKRDLFPDTVHPTVEGGALIAAEIYRVLTGQSPPAS